MKTAAVILAGGRGTRSADPHVPKIAQQIGGKPLLQWHLDLLSDSEVNEVLLVTAHLADQVEALFQESDPKHLQFRLVHETQPRGTFPALRQAREESDADRFLVILGDVWASFPVDALISSWAKSGKSVCAVVHPSLHPQDSDAVIPYPDGSVVVIPKGHRSALTRNMSATGVFGLTQGFIDSAADLPDIGSNVMQVAASSDELYAYVSSHYFKDTGTPDRLARAREDWKSGAFSMRGKTDPRPALILDRDGVINPALPEVYRPEDLRLVDGVGEAIAHANSTGIPVLVATNQPGIAKGFMSFEAHEDIRAQLDALLIKHGAFVDDYAFCPHHPDSGFDGEVRHLKISCGCRKPEPGLLLDLMAHHGVNSSRAVMVGDSERDAQAADAAGIEFLWVDEDHRPAEVLRVARERVAC